MRILLLFRGSPGVGKSTYIRENGLEPYTLSPDVIRLQLQAPQITIDGNTSIGGNLEKVVWDDYFFPMLERRMSNGDFTVIDATNSKTNEMNRYVKLAKKYRYRINIVDMTDVPIDEVKSRNSARSDSYKIVPDNVIDRMYARFKTQKIPSAISVIIDSDPDSLKYIWYRPFDITDLGYKKVFVIGDIHGCFDVLNNFFNDYDINDTSNLFIFIGDYVDRGIQNDKVIRFLLDNYTRSNVVLIEGNHERWLYHYGEGLKVPSKEFALRTKPQLDQMNVEMKDIRKLYYKCLQCSWFRYKDYNFLVTHGGIPGFSSTDSSGYNRELSLISTEQLIKGVGKYADYDVIAQHWSENMDDKFIQVFGHRNTKNSPIKIHSNVAVLEGRVEFGGDLRVVEFDLETLVTKGNDEGMIEHYYKNPTYRVEREEDKKPEIDDDKIKELGYFNYRIIAEGLDPKDTSVDNQVAIMRLFPKYIKEKNFGDVSSYNFSSLVFKDNKKWNEFTIKARGLYISNTSPARVVARSYDKFFNINEMEETNISHLKSDLSFPIRSYVKENGYLCILSTFNDELFFATKSDCGEGPYREWFKEAIYKHLEDNHINEQDLINFLKDHNVSMVFENVDIINDPHIIDYPEKKKLVLLDIIENEIGKSMSRFTYDNLAKYANEFKFIYKEEGPTFNDVSEFIQFYNDRYDDYDYTYNGRIIEGFVFEDSKGFMFKMKLPYYRFWKRIRGIIGTMINMGNVRDTTIFYNAIGNFFYAWFREYLSQWLTRTEREENSPQDIITLRDMFFASDKYKEMIDTFGNDYYK